MTGTIREWETNPDKENNMIETIREWETEPDYEVWTDLETGLTCVIARSSMGHLCGYVEANFHSKDNTDELDKLYQVHGGITWADQLPHWYKDKEKPPNHFYIGFDCGHSGDLSPYTNESRLLEAFRYHLGDIVKEREDPYRNWAYVKEQVTSLARQVREQIMKPALANYRVYFDVTGTLDFKARECPNREEVIKLIKEAAQDELESDTFCLDLNSLSPIIVTAIPEGSE